MPLCKCMLIKIIENQCIYVKYPTFRACGLTNNHFSRIANQSLAMAFWSIFGNCYQPATCHRSSRQKLFQCQALVHVIGQWNPKSGDIYYILNIIYALTVAKYISLLFLPYKSYKFPQALCSSNICLYTAMWHIPYFLGLSELWSHWKDSKDFDLYYPNILFYFITYQVVVRVDAQWYNRDKYISPILLTM